MRMLYCSTKSVLILSISLLFLLFSCTIEETSNALVESEQKENLKQLNDSTWVFNEYLSEELSIDITNHHLTNYSIEIRRKDDMLLLDLNELNIPWKTPSVEWINEQMICFSTWWSGPFCRYIFVPLTDPFTDYIYIDKDIKLADSSSNIVVYFDTLIQDSQLMLTAENLLTRNTLSVQMDVPSEVDHYPFYDSLSMNDSQLIVWINGERKKYDVKSLK